ncbi:sensor histidine kinase [Streptomyces sp. NPDC002851]
MAASRRLRPRTVRGRATLAVTAVLALALAVGSVVLVSAVRADLRQEAEDTARQQVKTVAELLDSTGADSGGDYVIGPDGDVTRGEPAQPVPDASPAPSPTPSSSAEDESIVETSGDGRYRISTAINLTSTDETLARLLIVLIPGVLLILLLAALLTWYAVGRALAPVEAVRRDAAEITATDLHRRLPVPASHDEISRLATTLNSTLDRLERAVSRLKTFTADVSHELRSPLATLRARLEVAAARPERADWPRVAHEALKDTAQLQNLVSDLLLLARLDAHTPTAHRPLDLADLAHAQTQRLKDDPAVEVRAPAPTPVNGAASQLERLLTNLVDNACRHADSAVRLTVTTDNGQAVVEVSDDGPGIPAADRERVFERFTRLDTARDRDSGGTGLGLAIARSIATAHGGTLTAEDPDPVLGGARLVLRLPHA